MQARREVSNPFRDFEDVRAATRQPARHLSQHAWLYRGADVLVAIVSIALAFLISNLKSLPPDIAGFLALRISIKNLLVMVLFAGAWAGFFHAFGLYRKQGGRVANLRLLTATLCGSSYAVLFVFTSRSGAFGFNGILWCWLFGLGLTLICRLLLWALTEGVTTASHPRHVLVVGTGARAARVSDALQKLGSENYQLLGFVDTARALVTSSRLKSKLLGDLSQLEQILLQHQIDEVLITLPLKSCYEEVQQTIEICERTGVECKYLSDIFRPSFSQVVTEDISGFRVTSIKPTYDDSRFIAKRAIDIAGASLGLVVLSPAFMMIALAIKLTSGGPVIFTQERHGRNRRRFRMYKFRTMVNQAEQLQPLLEPCNEAVGPIFKIRNDPRVTQIGALLRRTSMDELPQLLNVIKGEMSLVGPRPLPVRDVSKFDEGWLLRRFCVVPGLTGLWQVNGRDTTNFEAWVKQDFEYIDHWSLALDFQILLKTIPVVVRGTGAV